MDNLNSLLDHYKLPILLSLVGIVLIIGGIFSSNLHLGTNSTPKPTSYPEKSKVTSLEPQISKTILIDVSGAVKNPKVYSLDSSSRVEDAIKASGGFKTNANADYISKSINLSQKLVDGAKIYIPFTGENTGGVVAGVSSTTITSSGTSSTAKISINSASEKDLDTLPSVGAVTAQKIINGRPYQSIDDLLSKKVVSNSVFTKIKDLVTLD